MTKNKISITQWMDALLVGADELAAVALGFEGATVLGLRNDYPPNTCVAIISIVGDEEAAHVGIACSPDACTALVRILLGYEPHEPDPPCDEISDGLNEIANILAGQIKRFLKTPTEDLKLGFPLFIRGCILVTDKMGSAFAEVKLGDIPVTFVLLTGSKDTISEELIYHSCSKNPDGHPA